MCGCPDRNNLLLDTLGPGLSACLLDLFMMNAGPNLRGKVAHGEMDMSGVFLPFFQSCSQTSPLPPSPSPPSSSDDDPRTWCSDSTRKSSRGGDFGSKTRSVPDADIVKLVAGVFLVLCWRYDLGRGAMVDAHPGVIEPNNEGVVDEPAGGRIGGENSSSPPPPPTRLSNGGFVQALSAADVCCSGWVPRFHPHELLEADLRTSREEFDRLALALQRRMISIELLPAGDLARMSVTVLRDAVQAKAAAGREAGDKAAGNPPNTPKFEKGVEAGQQQEDGKGMKALSKHAQSSEEKTNHGKDGGKGEHKNSPSLDEASAFFESRARSLVLRVTDTASRLVPPPSLGPKPAERGSGHPPPSATSGVRETPPPPKKKNQDSAGHGVFPGLLRVNEALREHTIRLTTRFERTTTQHQHPCHHLHSGGRGGGDGSTKRSQAFSAPAATGETLASAPTSAFAVHFRQHSQLCSDAAAPPPCPSDGRHQQGRCSVFFQDCAANDGVRATNTGAPEQDGSVPPTTRKGSSGRGRPSACSGDKQQWSRMLNSGEGLLRVSPPTNAVKAVPLPQIACMSWLCRSCAEVARGLRERIVELEVLLAAGSARSGQRRAYATTLRVAPTLLRFLASAVAAVELFVIEWDQRTASSSARTAVVAETAEETTAAAAAAVPPDAAAGLHFLRRLAAVTGTLGLCVTPGAEPSSRSSSNSGSSSNSERATCKEKEKEKERAAGGSAGKKGFVQALAELAAFLETKTARQGFAG